MVYAYDQAGNILSKKKYAYINPASSVSGSYTNYSYGYGNGWGDQLTSYNGKSLTYDEIGNPLTYGTYSYTWKYGRQLSTIENGTTPLASFQYNDEGIRTSKIVTVNEQNILHEYDVVGGQINREVVHSSSSATSAVMKDLRYYYDASGRPIAIRAFTRTSSTASFTDTTYYLLTNLQGDVVGIYNASGTKIYEYAYDAWGNIIKSSQVAAGGGDAHAVNPFRYRGYYYDTETGLYYLQSRYYNPEWGRFLNADFAEVVSNENTLTDKNLYAYCDNNPVMRVDEDGEFWNIAIGVGAGAVIGAVSSIVSQALDGTLNFKSKETWLQIGVSALSGGITGGFAASGVPVGGQVLVNGAAGMLSSVANTAIESNTTPQTAGDYLLSAGEGLAFGLVGGLLGGAGTGTPHLSSAFHRVCSNGNWSYYFSQINREAVKAGIQAIPGIAKGVIPSLSKSYINLTKRMIERYAS